MHFRQARAHLGRDPEGGAVHAERGCDVAADVLAQPHAADRLDHLSGPVDVDAVLPTLTGVERERNAQRDVATRAGARHVHGLVKPRHLGVPDVVDEPGAVRQQVAQRDLRLRRARHRLTLGVPAGQHPEAAEFRNDVSRRIVQRHPALLDQLHRGGADHRLGHRRDPHHRILAHGRALALHPDAGCAFVNGVARACHRGRHARHVARGDRAAQQRIGGLPERGTRGTAGAAAGGRTARGGAGHDCRA